jgi:DNA-binding NarL/FixJ family response regulator
MDIRLMGAMDGIEAARQIKVFSSAMLIFTTGYQDPDLRERAMALNPTAYIIKPISWRDIDAIIRSNQSTQESPG